MTRAASVDGFWNKDAKKHQPPYFSLTPGNFSIFFTVSSAFFQTSSTILLYLHDIKDLSVIDIEL